MTLATLAEAIRASRGFVHKRDISAVLSSLANHLPGAMTDLASAVEMGDDCAAIADGHGAYLLFAIEGLVEDFIERMPWFAGYCSVMVNVSDIYAMGGEPIAVVDALWSRGMEPGFELLRGMAEASQRYGVPIVGGHSNNQSARGQLAVAILGRATRLLRSAGARPGDRLVVALDLRGSYREPYAYWDASTAAPAPRLKADLSVLSALANEGLCEAAKDVSMAGVIGTALMLCESSHVGALIDVDAIPRPLGIPLERWLLTFPSYGFVLSVPQKDCRAVQERFTARDIACAVVGTVDAASAVRLGSAGDEALLWDWNLAPFIGAHATLSRSA